MFEAALAGEISYGQNMSVPSGSGQADEKKSESRNIVESHISKNLPSVKLCTSTGY